MAASRIRMHGQYLCSLLAGSRCMRKVHGSPQRLQARKTNVLCCAAAGAARRVNTHWIVWRRGGRFVLRNVTVLNDVATAAVVLRGRNVFFACLSAAAPPLYCAWLVRSVQPAYHSLLLAFMACARAPPLSCASDNHRRQARWKGSISSYRV